MDNAAWNEHLVAFHRKHANPTGEIMEPLRTPRGVSSYELLAERIKELAPDARDILDVGCGSGELLALIAGMYGPNVALRGIDLSEADIARARARVPQATFIVGDASDLHLGQKSQDVVTSHLAFMGMPDLRVVLQRIRMALRERGVLVFVVEDPLANGTLFALIGRSVAAMRERFPAVLPGAPRREPIEQDDVLLVLLGETGFSGVSIEHFSVGAKLSEDQLWRAVVLAYPFGLLDDEELCALREALHSEIVSLAHGAEATLTLRLVVARIS